MKYVTYLITSVFCLLFGILYFLVQQGFIIVRSSSYKKETEQECSTMHVEKKQCKLIFWHNGKWHSEQSELIWSDDMAKNLHYLVNSWLTYGDEEQMMFKKVILQTVLLSSHGQEAYLSFDRNPVEKEDSTFEKWMWVESLLKTIRENGIHIQTIHFLVHHAALHDNHLDFSNPWPVAGFLPS